MSKPGRMRCAFCRLRRNNPAPTNATSDSAICVATSMLRRLNSRRELAGALGFSFNSVTRFGLEACTAGARPKSRPVVSAMPSVNNRTRRSG
jgi:hypothetical protein